MNVFFAIPLLLFTALSACGAEAVMMIRPVFPNQEIAVWAGRNAELNLEVWGPVESEWKIFGKRWQVAGSMAVPLSPELTLVPSLKFLQRSWQTVTVSVPIPPFAAPTRMLVDFVGRESSGALSSAVQVKLRAYPDTGAPDFQRTLAQLAEKGGGLAIFGASLNVRSFLASAQIPFEDAGEVTPKNFDRDLLYVGELNQEAFAQTFSPAGGARAVVFVDDDERLPGVYQTGTVAKVTLPLMETLSSDPRSQWTFFQILTDTLNHAGRQPAETP